MELNEKRQPLNVYFHGTSSKFLDSILKHGEVVSESKKMPMNFKTFMEGYDTCHREYYDARVEASPNYQWYQKVMNAGLHKEAGQILDNIKTGSVSFLPVAIKDGEKIPMIGHDHVGRYNGRGKFEEALSVIEKNGKLPGWKDAEFEIVIIVGKKQEPMAALDTEGNVKI